MCSYKTAKVINRGPERPQCATMHLQKHHLFTVKWKESEPQKHEIIESKTIDAGSHLSKLSIFTCSLSSYSQQLLLQLCKSGSSETRAELHISWYTASERTAHPVLAHRGRALFSEETSLHPNTTSMCSSQRWAACGLLALLEWSTHNDNI